MEDQKNVSIEENINYDKIHVCERKENFKLLVSRLGWDLVVKGYLGERTNEEDYKNNNYPVISEMNMEMLWCIEYLWFLNERDIEEIREMAEEKVKKMIV